MISGMIPSTRAKANQREGDEVLQIEKPHNCFVQELVLYISVHKYLQGLVVEYIVHMVL